MIHIILITISTLVYIGLVELICIIQPYNKIYNYAILAYGLNAVYRYIDYTSYGTEDDKNLKHEMDNSTKRKKDFEKEQTDLNTSDEIMYAKRKMSFIDINIKLLRCKIINAKDTEEREAARNDIEKLNRELEGIEDLL